MAGLKDHSVISNARDSVVKEISNPPVGYSEFVHSVSPTSYSK